MSPPGSGPIEVVYSTHCVVDPTIIDWTIIDRGGSTPTRLWVWDEESREAVAFPLPEGALGPQLSSDQSLIVFRQKVTETDHEIRVISSDGLSERKLAAISLKDIRQRFPGASSIRLEYGWLEGTQRVFVLAGPLYELETSLLDTVVVVDALTGEAKTIAPPGAVYALWSSPDGEQIAVLGLGEIQFISSGDGQVQSVISLPLNWAQETAIAYSPDGKLLAVQIETGVAIIDTAIGTHAEVDFDYMAWGAGDAPLYLPPLHWRDNNTLLILAAPPKEGDVEGLDVFEELLDWDFAVYLVDATQSTISTVRAFRGVFPSAFLSPDYNYLAFSRAFRDSESRELYLADLLTGKEMLYTTGNQLSYFNWGPNSLRFFYAAIEDETRQAYLGEVDRAPRPYAVRAHSIRWIDEDRFLAKPGSPDLELHLYSVRGEDILIASVQSGE